MPRQDKAFKRRFHVLQSVLHFQENNNRKYWLAVTCGWFEMVEATGVEPVS